MQLPSVLLDPEEVILKGGTQVLIRPIRADDAPDLQDTFQRLSRESIYLRFLSVKKELTDEEARALSSVDYHARMAFVAICKKNGREIVVGVSAMPCWMKTILRWLSRRWWWQMNTSAVE